MSKINVRIGQFCTYDLCRRKCLLFLIIVDYFMSSLFYVIYNIYNITCEDVEKYVGCLRTSLIVQKRKFRHANDHLVITRIMTPIRSNSQQSYKTTV